MTLEEFANEVASMRRRQKLFNAHLGEHGEVYGELLSLAIEAECVVDAMVKAILEPQSLTPRRP